MGAFEKLGSMLESDGIRRMFGLPEKSAPLMRYSYDPSNQTYTQLAKGGKVKSASKRADGIAQRGKTKGTMVMCGGGYAKGKK